MDSGTSLWDYIVFFQVILFLEGNDKCERGLGNILTPVEKVGLVLSFLET